MDSKYIRYYYFPWKDGRPDIKSLQGDEEEVYETPTSKDGMCDGWAFIVSNAQLTKKDVDFLDTLDLENGVAYDLSVKKLKECTVHLNMKNIEQVLKRRSAFKNTVYKVRVKYDSKREKLRGKFRAKSTAYTSVGKTYKRKAYLNSALRRWPLGEDEEIVVFEMQEKEVLSGPDVKYGIKNGNKKN